MRLVEKQSDLRDRMEPMDLNALVIQAAREGASDIHIQAGRPLALRIGGQLRTRGPALAPDAVDGAARRILGRDAWPAFEARGSADFALDLGGVRCRLNVLRSSRGIGMAIRLLAEDLVTIDKLNLHPDIKRLVEHPHGLVLVTGPTGCGKSSTLAALIQEVNLSRTAHIVTLEQPIEYDLVPIRAFIRQREVGRDTPSFSQGLLDATREDIDVLMVGEMRDRETMRLTLDAAETGHLVLATMHSATPIEALQRVVSAFPSDEQPRVSAQLADVLRAVLTQHLVWREDACLRVPECEMITGSSAVRATLRKGEFFKLNTVLDTGARDGMWSKERYRAWLDQRTTWYEPPEASRELKQPEPRSTATEAVAPERRDPDDLEAPAEAPDVIVIKPDERSLADILEELDEEP